MHKNDVEIKEKSLLYQGFITVKRYLLRHKLFSGSWSDPFFREVALRNPAAAALLYDPVMDKIVLLEQFRAGALEDRNSPWLIEVVAGIIEDNETPEELVIREVQEEAGLTVLDLIPIFDFWASPGGSNEHISLFCARVDASKAGGVHGLPEENEDIRVQVVDVEAALDLLRQGKITNAICLISLLWFQLHQDEVRSRWCDKTQ